ncbi:restriction endonuclease subunit S [Barnesiella intestinihominis]|uniref:restriction endonuclease subunit S n=1 Tax=Barnesiella intestinihominis TaxID=487174 RepID=UPI0032C1E95F
MPEGWAIIKVGDAAIYVNGRAFKPEEWNNKGLPIIRIQNLNDTAAHYNYSCDVYEDKYLIHKGDLLFAWAASLGTYIWNGNEAWLNQHIFKVLPYPFIDKKFLYYAFQSMISDFITQSHGSGMVHITKRQFENITLLLPPLDEQKRIVRTLERYYKQVDAIMESL